ncbi:conserved hypothetical protein [Deferribacter desulfuricans SSM1]|uniref:Sulfate exporter family transporter n=1 Tax=Deferribacter desulfuricans (strain DSM 14783 / JCM 11476 / NBRC 101012 / SSM1) TaxID=639282 RepID=D3PE72_DEFDS|nr:putative sulfate exporter family transporter [Deferribacter desulfuricans]BAI80895.1 conserved hypothetical protein [Deferribacter desulfuricans SSM1]
MNKKLLKIVYLLAFLICALPFMESTYALLLGLFLALVFTNPFPTFTAKSSKQLLKISVIGLGFGVNFYQVLEVGKHSILLTFSTIITTLFIGYFLGKLYKIEQKTSTLISFGTAICGGSAIAAMAPAIDADNNSIAISLATVFTLNAVALIIFPIIGHLLHLSQSQFGLFAALAIHDTSSVVGAASIYGATALSIGTTVKLTRALWIAPFAFTAGLINGKKNNKISFPLFILGFILAAFLSSYLPQYSDFWHKLNFVAKRLLVMTLFLIGTGLSKETLREVGIKPLLQGVSLWFIVTIGTLTLIFLNILNYPR